MTASRGLLGFGARKAHVWPAELLPLALALYQVGMVSASPRIW